MNYSEIRATARDRLRGNWGKAVLAGFLAALLGATIGSSGSGLNLNLDAEHLRQLPPEVYGILLPILAGTGMIGLAIFLISGVIQLGYAKFLLAQQDGRPYQVSDLFSQFGRFGTGFAQKFLTTLYTMLWTLLFVIPGIIKSLSYAMTPFILEDHPELTANQAITASRELMDGHKWELFVLGLTFIGWNLLAAMTMGIGFLWVVPYINASYAAFYRRIVPKPRYYID